MATTTKTRVILQARDVVLAHLGNKNAKIEKLKRPAQSLQEVADRLGCSTQTVSIWRRNLKKAGVQMPKLFQGRRPNVIDARELNALIKGTK